MAKAVKVGDIGTDHDGFPPTPVTAGSPDVKIDGMPAARVGDPLAPHDKPKHPPHGRTIASGSSTVFINGKAAAVTGGAISCGGVTIGAGTVNIGDAPGSSSSSNVNHPSSNTSSRQSAQAQSQSSASTGNQSAASTMKASSHASVDPQHYGYWPPYDPTTGEDLTAKLRDVLEANHKKAIILDLDDALATLQSMWEEFQWEDDGTDLMKGADKTQNLGNHGMAVYRAYDLAKQFGDLGVKADVFTSKGKEYIAITTKNNSDKVLRHVLVNGIRLKVNGHKYRINNPKVIQLGLTPQSRATAFKGGAALTFIISAAINTNELVFNDDYYWQDWFGNVGVDMFKAVLTFGVAEVALIGLGTLFGGTPIILGAAIVVGLSVLIDIVVDDWKVSESVIEALEVATE